LLTALIFAATYAIIAVGRAPFLRIDRTGAAVVGAILMVVTGSISFDGAAAAVDSRTIVLLFGMMIIVAHLRLAGGLAVAVSWLNARLVHPAGLLVALVFASGLLSALFVNDTVCIALTPVVLDIAAARRHRALPYLLALAMGSNVGSVATITGNPQNMLVGSLSAISFRSFSAALGPVAVAGLIVTALVLWVMFRGDLTETTADFEPPRPIRPHRPLLLKTMLVIAGVLTGFLAGYDTALVALAGAAALLLTRRVRPRKIYAAIDWDLLMLFVGLFVVVGAAERAGIAAWMFRQLQPLGVDTIAGLSAAAAVLSNVISNVPAVMLLARLVPQLPDPHEAWLTLAMASTLAGNFFIVGSIANLIVVEGARRRGVVVTFSDYARAGVPISVTTMALGIFWLAVLY
jgi:Na+/H+ antiporter NhaD/arsenite permease-like protein